MPQWIVLLTVAIVAWVLFSVGGGLVVGRLIRRAESLRAAGFDAGEADAQGMRGATSAENAPAATSRIAASPRNSFVASRFPFTCATTEPRCE